MSNNINNLYEFGEFRLDTQERVLIRQNETIILAPKVFDTLEVLIKSDGKIVSKDDLMNEIWADSFVEESNLTQNIYVLRQNIGKEFIETVPRRGYRFAADVRSVSPAEIPESFNTSNNPADVVLAQRTRTHIVEEAFVEDTTQANVITKPGKHYPAFAFALLAILILGGFGLWAWNKSPADTASAAFEKMQIRNLTDSGKVASIAISPDSKFFAYTTNKSGIENSFYLRDLKLNQEIKVGISQKMNPSFLTFSPGGDHLFFLNRDGYKTPSDIYRVTRFGGDAELVVEDVSSEFSISKDGKQIVFVRVNEKTNEHSLIIRNLETKAEKVLLKKNLPEGFSLISSPVWSFDESKIYVATRKQKTFYTKLISIDITTSEENLIPTPKWFRLIIQIKGLPNENKLIMATRRNGIMSQIYKFDLDTNEVKNITNDLNNYRKVSVSADGKNIVALQFTSRSELKILPDAKFDAMRELTSNSFGRAGRNGLEVTPDNKILYVSIASRNREIWSFDLNDDSTRQLTKDTDHPSQNPTAAANGRHIYYVSVMSDTRNIKRMDLDGQNQIELISEKNSNDSMPAVSPDEKYLYFIRETKGDSEIWRKVLPDGRLEKLELPKNVNPNMFLRVSPDGRFLAFRQMGEDDDGRQTDIELFFVGVISLEDLSAEPKVFRVNSDRPTIRWTETSDAFDFVENTPTSAIIKRQMIFGENTPEIVTELPRTNVHDFLWMPNTNDLIISDIQREHDGILITNFD